MRTILFLYSLFFCLLAASPSVAQKLNLPPGEVPIDFAQARLIVETPSGQIAFRVELAETPAQRQRGLMWRSELPDDYGMLFLYNQAEPRRFWMRNTITALDIIFFDENGVYVSQARGRPLDETPLPSAGPTQFILEIRAGLAETYGIGEGSRLLAVERIDTQPGTAD